ncbi:hypothetical protein TNCV_3587951 [Trichonephila clavipes]|nr:hypothetical protein TNCV_3587951 [Trichonephila clavipes]
MPAVEMRFPHTPTKGENKHRPSLTSPHRSRFRRVGFFYLYYVPQLKTPGNEGIKNIHQLMDEVKYPNLKRLHFIQLPSLALPLPV